jgi:hypothetical protein
MPAFLNKPLRQLLSIAVLLVFISGCTAEKSKKDMLIEEMALDLEKSNTYLNSHSNHELNKLNNKKTEPITMEKAGVWLPKAERVFQLTSQYTNYLNSIKKNKNNQPDSILFKTDFYTNELKTVDKTIVNEFSSNIAELKNYVETKYSLRKKANGPFIETLINKAKRMEVKMITYCNEQVSSFYGHGFLDYYSSIIGQNSTILRPGETLEINAGIGAYSRAAQPKITAAGINIPLNEYGVSEYKAKAPSNPGNYKVPVRISYINKFTGKEEWLERTIEYTVVKPCN